jgi:hypothetical protein
VRRGGDVFACRETTASEKDANTSGGVYGVMEEALHCHQQAGDPHVLAQGLAEMPEGPRGFDLPPSPGKSKET